MGGAVSGTSTRADGATLVGLAASVSNDVHPRALLQVLLRLSVAELVAGATEGGDDRVRLRVEAFVPPEGAPEMLQLLGDNVADHLAAAVLNVLGEAAPMLEQSIHADNLREESVERLHALARQAWQASFHDLVREATVLRERDALRPGVDQRIRIGMYFYREPDRQG